MTSHPSTPATDAAGTDGETLLLRHVSTQLHLWGLCERTGCLRSRACGGEPRDCLARYAPLVPELARDWVQAMVEAHEQDLTFEEFLAEASEESEAMAAWCKAVEASMRARARKPRAREPA